MRYLETENPYIWCRFTTGDSVTITIYKSSDSSVIVNAVSMSELGSTGYFKYQFNPSPTELTEYFYIATNTIEEHAGKIILGGYPDSIKSETDKIQTMDDILDRVLTATEIRPASINDISATTTQFITTLSDPTDFWNRMAMLFTSGNNAGQMRRIKDYNTDGTIKIQTPVHEAPADGDTFILLTVRAFLTPDIEDLADAVWDELKSEHETIGTFGELATEIRALWDEIGGKWEITGNQMIFYKSDNITEFMRFNLFDSSGNPSMTNIYKRERV